MRRDLVRRLEPRPRAGATGAGAGGAGDGAGTPPAREQLTGRPQFDPDGLCFITYGRGGAEPVPVGSACAWLPDPDEKELGIRHMVCVLPEHRGHRLSYPLCLAVLHRFRQRGFRRVRLGTGEHRLGAVKVYLRLGFHPVYRHPLHSQQWEAVLRQLDWTEPIRRFTDDDVAGTV